MMGNTKLRNAVARIIGALAVLTVGAWSILAIFGGCAGVRDIQEADWQEEGYDVEHETHPEEAVGSWFEILPEDKVTLVQVDGQPVAGRPPWMRVNVLRQIDEHTFDVTTGIGKRMVLIMDEEAVIHIEHERIDTAIYDAREKEWWACQGFSSPAEAQAVWAGGNAYLDHNQTGRVCQTRWEPELLPAISLKQSATHESESWGGSPSSSGSIYVRGHYRTTKSGKQVYVRPHTRRRR